MIGIAWRVSDNTTLDGYMVKQAFLCIVLIFLAISTTFAGTVEYDRELVEAARDLGRGAPW